MSTKAKRTALLTGVEAADRLGVTERWIRALAKAGTLTKHRGKYPWPTIREEYNAHLRAAAHAAAGPADLKVEKALYARAKRELAELELAERQGQLIALEDHLRVVEHLLDHYRSVLLAMPGAYARTLGLTDGKGERALRDVAHKMLVDTRDLVLGDLDRAYGPTGTGTASDTPKKPSSRRGRRTQHDAQ